MFFLSLRHMLSRKKQILLVLLGIVFGVSAYIIFTGIMFGFREYIIDQIVNNNYHINVSAREEFVTRHELDDAFFGSNVYVHWLREPAGRRDSNRIKNALGWYDMLSHHSEVLAYSPQLQITALIKHGAASKSISLIGCYPGEQTTVTTIQNFMVKGRFSDIAQGGNRMIVGEDLLKRMGAQMNDTLLVSAADGRTIPFKIVGVFKVGVRHVDNSTAYALLGDVQKLNQTPGVITDIAIRLKNVDLAATLATRWDKFKPDTVLSWDQANAHFLSVFKLQDFIRNFMSLAILLVAGFGIYNVLNILISQKRMEIAILRSMGYERLDIVRLFMMEGVVLGLVGGVLGLLLGYLGSRYMQTWEIIGGRYGGGRNLLISFNTMIYLHGFLMAIIVSFISSILPAWYAGKLSPLEILRSEIKE